MSLLFEHYYGDFVCLKCHQLIGKDPEAEFPEYQVDGQGVKVGNYAILCFNCFWEESREAQSWGEGY